jgi:hypothetical protein
VARSKDSVPEDSGMIAVSLEGDPEQVAGALVGQSLPDFFLSDIDLSTSMGMARWLNALVSRPYMASIEADELVAFVDRNRDFLRDGRLLEALKESVEGASDEDVTAWFARSRGPDPPHSHRPS